MRSTAKMPRVAETTDEVVVSEWLVSVGDYVAANQAVVTVETDKALVEVTVPVGGLVLELLVDPDDDIRTGEPFIVVETSPESRPPIQIAP